MKALRHVVLPARLARLRRVAAPSVRACSTNASPLRSLATVLEAYRIPSDAVLADADAAAVDRQLQFLSVLGVHSIPATVERHPSLLLGDPHFAAPRVEYLLSLGVHEIGKVVQTCPQILGCDITYDLHRKVQILQALGVSSIARWITRNPYIVLMDVDSDMRPAVEFYRKIEYLKLGKLLSSLPAGVAFAPPQETQKKLDYFKASPPPRVPQCIARALSLTQPLCHSHATMAS